MWGFGTALGELPPYFMARAARISGMEVEDEELEEFTELIERKKKANPADLVSSVDFLSWVKSPRLLKSSNFNFY